MFSDSFFSIGKFTRHLITLMVAVGLFLSSTFEISNLSIEKGESDSQKLLYDFRIPDLAGSWFTVDDVVMGGVSSSFFELTEANTGRFFGELSLENNGGFCSVRSTPQNYDLGEFSGIRIRVKGDGRSYGFNIYPAGRMNRVYYQQSFETVAGEWIEKTFLFEDFEPLIIGRRVNAGPLNPSAIGNFGVILADYNPGTFEFHFEQIHAVKK